MTNNQKYGVDLLARGLNGITLTLVLGFGVYVQGIAEDVHGHHTDPGVHETPRQKENRTRSIATDVVAVEAAKTREDLKEIKQLIEKLRDEVARK